MLPAYAIVAAAEAAETGAETAETAAAASAAAAAGDAALVESYSGAVPIIENEPFESNNLDFTVGSWRDYDFIQLVVRDSNATDQIDRPSTLIPVAGLDANGEARSPFNNNDEIRVERTAASDVLTLNITGWSGHPTTADVLTVYGIRSGVEAGGGGGGGGEDTDLSIANRGATTLDVASSTGTDATVPAASTTEAGLMTAADKTALDAAGSGVTNLAVANRDADSLDVTSDTGTDATVPSASTTEAGLMAAADKTALDRSQPHWYLTGGTEVGRTATYTAPADWPGISAIAEGTAITFEVPDPWGYNGSAGLAVQIGTNLINVNGSGGDQFPASEVRAGATYRAIWDGSTRWRLLDSGITNAEVKAANEANDDTNAFTDADETALDNAGGQHRFGAVDPVATDGNDKDEWTNTADGTLWIKAAGAWTLQYTYPSGGSGPGPTHTEQYLAGKATNTLVAADFTGAAGVAYAAGSHTATMPTVTGNVFGAVARLATDPDPTYADVNGTGLNQFVDFTQQAGTVTINGAAYNVWVSNFAVFATGDEVEFR